MRNFVFPPRGCITMWSLITYIYDHMMLNPPEPFGNGPIKDLSFSQISISLSSFSWNETETIDPQWNRYFKSTLRYLPSLCPQNRRSNAQAQGYHEKRWRARACARVCVGAVRDKEGSENLFKWSPHPDHDTLLHFLHWLEEHILVQKPSSTEEKTETGDYLWSVLSW